MRTQFRRTKRRIFSEAAQNWRPSVMAMIWLVSAISIVGVSNPPPSHINLLPRVGEDSIIVEAEAYSATSGQDPHSNSCPKCSGQANLGYYSFDTWFEIEVEAPQMLNYHVSLRAASPTGTNIELQLVRDSSSTTLATLPVGKNSGSWSDYSDTTSVMISLPAGMHTLRFKNIGESTNVDFLRFAPGAATDVVAQRLNASAGPDINPLKGWMTGWWRNEPHASVGYQTIEWKHLEPKDDEFAWKYIEDNYLNRPGSNGRHFILQLVCDWDTKTPVEANFLGPDWLLEAGVEEFYELENPNDPQSRMMRVTDYNDELFIAEANEAIRAFVDHYKDDPRAYVIQVGMLGFWGEWHTFPKPHWSPSNSTKQSVLDTYFSRMGDDHLTQVRYPDEPINVPRWRMGYTNGSVVLTNHGREFGDQINASGAWVNGPVGGEWPPNVHEANLWERFFTTPEGPDYINIGHYSTIFPPENRDILEKIPGWSPNGQFMEMHRQLGYQFQASEVRYLAPADDSDQMHIEVDVTNIGIAPFYKKWKVQLAVMNATTGTVSLVDTNFDIRSIAAGETVTLTGSCDFQETPGNQYQLGLRIVQPKAEEPKSEVDMLTKWNLKPRNVYVVLANEVEVVEGIWGAGNALQGGWNILGDIDTAAPQIESIVINNGEVQRSRVTEIKVAFSEIVDPVDHLSFFLVNNTTNVNFVPKVATQIVNGKTVATLTFEGKTIIGRSLPDGNYTLTILDTILDLSGNPLEGNGVNGSTSINFSRRFGDSNGDGRVNIVDLVQFRIAYAGTYNATFDFNDDGKIDKVDLFHFSSGNRR